MTIVGRRLERSVRRGAGWAATAEILTALEPLIFHNAGLVIILRNVPLLGGTEIGAWVLGIERVTTCRRTPEGQLAVTPRYSRLSRIGMDTVFARHIDSRPAIIPARH